MQLTRNSKDAVRQRKMQARVRQLHFGPALKKATRDPVGLWTLVIIVAVIVLLVGILFIGEHGWRAAGLDIDGRQR